MKLLWTPLVFAFAACAPSSSNAEAERGEAPSAAAARTSPIQDRVIGLLTLPQVYGRAPCEEYVPEDIALYADPDSSRLFGAVRVEQPWRPHEYGGCEGLHVGVRLATVDTAVDLPTLEYSYEMPAAIVLRRQGDWFKIRLVAGAGWIRGAPSNEFLALEDLLTSNLTYIAEPDIRGLSDSPGSISRPLPTDLIAEHQPVRVLQTQTADGVLWLKVTIQRHSPCESDDDSSSIAEGWLPAHTSSGEVTVWFHSRGC